MSYDVAQNETAGANCRFWSMFPLTRASHLGTGFFFGHSHVCSVPAIQAQVIAEACSAVHPPSSLANDRTPYTLLVGLTENERLPFTIDVAVDQK